MNKYVSGALIFASGALVGSVVTYFVVNKRATKAADDRIKSMQAYLDSKMRPYKVADRMNEAEEAVEKAALEEVHAKTEENYVDYSSISRNYVEKEVEKAEKEAPTDEKSGPRIISEDEFVDPIPYYEKISLQYDAENGVLVNPMDSVEYDISDIGSAILDTLVTGEETIIYVRNDRISVDYEVELM